ncbi:MAG: right-handed parallel beta-helix repeat-containing protein [Candidatus Krumholzibacteriota bacterium]|nr:right-handed parallel beta-helix repeat-containing protein [Candidatus Krumholzibacteriota bacterium]
MRHLLLSLVLAITLAGVASADILEVPDGYATIGAALAAAQAGDTVLVACGIYHESGLALVSGVKLFSETGGAYCATIDAQGSGPIFTGADLVTSTRVNGFTLTGGEATVGGGVQLTNSSPRFENCLFAGNTATDAEGGCLRVSGGSPYFTLCTFSGNSAASEGGACYFTDAAPYFYGCTFRSNEAGGDGGALWLGNSPATLTDCQFYENDSDGRGGGICLADGSDATISLATLFGNYAASNGGAFCCVGSAPSISSSTVVENSTLGSGAGLYAGWTSAPILSQVIIAFSTIGEGVGVDPATSSATFSCCDIAGNRDGDWTPPIDTQAALNGNLSVDPEFCGTESHGNYYLQIDSPCAPDNNSCGVLIGSHQVDCGIIATEEMTWSAVKSLY